MSRISNGYLDELYQVALEAGAVGGKITGAGGGGFLLLFCPYQKHKKLRTALNKLQELPFNLEKDGSKVIFNYQR
jgi:D-glycero-alpha-D-manno-heptose-7-phosphate kinase